MGDGHIAWEPLLRQLSGVGFHGPLILELAGGGQTGTIVEGAHRAQRSVRALLRRLERADSPAIDATLGDPTHHVPRTANGRGKRH